MGVCAARFAHGTPNSHPPGWTLRDSGALDSGADLPEGSARDAPGRSGGARGFGGGGPSFLLGPPGVWLGVRGLKLGERPSVGHVASAV